MKHPQNLDAIRSKTGFIIDMDGVIYHGNRLLEGVKEFVSWLKHEDKRFLFLTNSSERSPRELAEKLLRLGIEVGEEHFYTSALATAMFLGSQCPGGSAYVIGEAALTNAIYNQGLTMNDIDPDYVVVGEGRNYSYEKMENAVLLVNGGARLVGTNPDVNGPTERGIVPACGAMIAPIERATGKRAYFVGKPNPLMMRHALKLLECRREDVAIIGDRMDTDMVAGVESEIDTVLVLSGVTRPDDIDRFPYRPRHILQGVCELVGL